MISLICNHTVGHATQSTRQKLSSLANQCPTPMRGSHKDVLQMEKKSDTRDEGKVCVQFATRNSMQANNYAALSLEPGT